VYKINSSEHSKKKLKSVAKKKKRKEKKERKKRKEKKEKVLMEVNHENNSFQTVCVQHPNRTKVCTNSQFFYFLQK